MLIYSPEAVKKTISIVSSITSEDELRVTVGRLANSPSDDRARLQYLIAVFAAERGYHNSALENFQQLQDIPGFEGYGLAGRSFVLMRKHDFDGATAFLDKAAQSCGPNDRELRAVVAHTRAAALFHGGKPELARGCLCEAFHLTGEDHFLRGRVLDSLGMYYAQQHDFYAAREFYSRALVLKARFEDQAGLALSHGQLGRLYLDWGQLDQALEHFIEDKDLCTHVGDKRGEAQMHNLIGQVYLSKQEWQSAADWLAEAMRRCDLGQWSVLAGFARKDYAIALLEQDKVNEVDVVLSEALELFSDAGFEEGLAHVWRVAGKAMAVKRRYDEAETSLRKSIRWFQNNHEPAQAARSQLQLAVMMHARGLSSAMVSSELTKAVEWAEQARRDLLVQEIEAEMKRIEPVAYHAHIYKRVRGRTVETDTSSLISASLMSATVLFMDVQGSTEFARNLDPGIVMTTLNQLMSSFEVTLAKHGAMVTTYMGDGFMALVLGTDHARRAVAAAMDLISASQEFNEPRRLLNLTPLNIRVGIGTGEVCVGNVGTYRKMDYTAIGTTVNLAARIQSEGEVGLPCICRATHEMVQNDYTFRAQNPRLVRLKGLGEIEVWDVTGQKEPVRA
jgi:adenylate cyclase